MEARRILLSDLEEAALADQQRENAAQQAIHQLGGMLRQADHALDRLQQDDMLGSAIVRGCQDLADFVGNIADQMDQQSLDERRALAQACLEDARTQHNLMLREEGWNDDEFEELPDQGQPTDRELAKGVNRLASMSEDEMMNVISMAASILRDIEAALRSIDRDEADELADVATTVARLFVASLQSVQEKLLPEDLLGGRSSRSALEPSPRIEEITDDEGPRTVESLPLDEESRERMLRRKRMERLRVLWPPLGPAVASALRWGQDAAAKQPILAVALGITMWPAAVVAAFVGTPVVLADGLVQNIYNNFQDAPLVQGLERSAAQVYQTGRLYLICGKLVGRQTLRVVARQVERHGGVGQIAKNAGHFAVERTLHPIESIGMAWNGANWLVRTIRQHIDPLGDRERAAQDLQQ